MKNAGEKKTYADLLIIVIIVAAAAAWFFMASRPHPESKTPHSDELVLNVSPITPQDQTITTSYIGYITPINSVEVLPYISGFLEDIMVVGGQDVAQGDTMIVIRQDEYKANLNSAQAKVLQAQADYNNAEVFYRRMQQAGIKVISKTDLDNAKASYLSTQAQLAQAKAARDLAKVNYDYTVIQAPISGLVGNIDLTRGDYVSPASSPLLKIIQYDPIRVVFSIADKEYLDELMRNPHNLFADEKIRIKLSNGQIYAQPGQFKYLDNEINRNTNSVAVYADFVNTDRVLMANAYVDVLIDRLFKNVVIIPQSQAIMEDQGNYVYTIHNQKLQKTLVEILQITGTDYLLRNNFQPGEYLVLDKIGRISPEQKIKINVIQPALQEKK